VSAVCLLLSDDLLDASRVVGHGRAVGLTVVQCRTPEALVAAVGQGPACVILDLHNPGLDVDAVVGPFREAGVRVVAFGSHVDAARLKAARKAGCEEVLPRSAFFEDLEANLAKWAQSVC
jgi:CheY-like chemotaxis protein